MLTVLCPGETLPERLNHILNTVLSETPHRFASQITAPLEDQRLLFAVSLDESGVNHAFYDMVAWLRTHPGCLKGSVGGVVIDGSGDLYTKAAGRILVLAASMAGCTFPGRGLVEATGDLRNFTV